MSICEVSFLDCELWNSKGVGTGSSLNPAEGQASFSKRISETYDVFAGRSERNGSISVFAEKIKPELERCYLVAQKVVSVFKERIGFLRNQIETYRQDVAESKRTEPFFSQDPVCQIDASLLQIISDGISGSYFLVDEKGDKRFVVKPIDEDCGCLNNPKGFVTLSMQSPIRSEMPLYQSSLKEVLTYEVAREIGVGAIAPKTILVILESSAFSYLDESVRAQTVSSQPQDSSLCLDNRFNKVLCDLSIGVRKFCLDQVGPFPREKLCSAQEFIENSMSLYELQQALQEEHGCDEEKIASRFDQKQFEETNLLIWTTYDTDAHAGNILVYPLREDENGLTVYGFKKIDNGLTFPSANRQLRNALKYLPNMKSPLSDEGRAKILAINTDSISEKMKHYAMDSAIAVFLERMARLKEVAAIEGVTLKQIHRQMRRLEKTDCENGSGFSSDDTVSSG